MQEPLYELNVEKMPKQQKNSKKLKLKSQDQEVTISLNPQTKQLEVVSKDIQTQRAAWRIVKLIDLDVMAQTLVKTIDNLYDYICENTQEVLIYKDKIVIQLNYIKQTKDVEIELENMINFSEKEQKRLQKKIQLLKREVQKIQSNQKGTDKLTFPLDQTIVNLYYYSIVNLSEIRPVPRFNRVSLIKTRAQTILPLKGTFHFTMVLIQRLQPQKLGRKGKCQMPYIELGIKNDELGRETIKLRSQEQLFELQDLQQKEQTLYLRQRQWLKVQLNIDARTMKISKYLDNGSVTVVWNQFKKTNKLWLILTLHRLAIQTDLFVKNKSQTSQGSKEQQWQNSK